MRKGELLERLMATGRKNPVYDNIILCLFIALAGTFYYYERSHSIAKPIPYIITVLIFVIWMMCGLLCGKDRKIGFLIFAYAYWLIPYVYTAVYAARDKSAGYSKILSILNRIFNALLKNPFELSARSIHLDPAAMAAILLSAVMLSYVAGSFFSYFYAHKYLKKYEKDDEEEDIDYE